MTTLINKEFYIDLYLEHLSESSFLYEQRLSLLDDPEITWKGIDDFEQRFEAHIDGLVVGEDLALEVCKQQAIEGDFGELHAAIRVFCRQNRFDLLKEITEGIDPEEKERIKAVSDAINEEFPENWNSNLVQLLNENYPNARAILPKLMGYKRLKFCEPLLELLQKNDVRNIPEILWTLGRLRDEKIRVPLFNNYLQQNDEAISSAAALALLRIGELKVINFCQHSVSKNWTLLLLGFSGNHWVIPDILKIGILDKAHPDCLIALGLLGDISAVEVLLNHLTNKELGKSAAQSLNLITGAELYEDVFIPEEIDEDELFEEELEKLKAGEPIYQPGKEPGVTLNRISQKPEDWINWWNINKSKFNPKVRYRNGKPYSPSCLLENLESEKSSRKIRQLAYEEFVIRYNIDFPFETEMPVVKQKQSIAKYEQWVKENENRFNKGQWYFAGKL